MDKPADTTPLVSVIVLTYNQEDSVGRTLDSILAQKPGFAFEVVIGEDSSTDSTRRVCERYAARYPGIIRLMPAAPRKGITANYYDCLRACRGKYIADCSGDDRWPDEPRLAAHVALLEERPELSAVAGDWIENGAVREATDRPGAADFIGALAGLPVVLSAATFRADAVRGHIDSIVREDYPCEDLPLFMQLLESGPIARHPRPALIYSTADGTVSRPRDIAKARTYHERVIAMRLSLIGRHSLDPACFTTPVSRRIDHLARLTFRLGSGREALERLIEKYPYYRPSATSRLLLTLMRSRRAWNISRRLLQAVRPDRQC